MADIKTFNAKKWKAVELFIEYDEVFRAELVDRLNHKEIKSHLDIKWNNLISYLQDK